MREAIKSIMQPQPGQRTVSILRMVFWGSWIFISLHLGLILWTLRDATAGEIAAIIGSETALVLAIGGMVVGGQVRKSNETTRAVRETEIAKAAAGAGPDSTITVTGKGGE